MSTAKFIKIDANGQRLPDDATNWVAVELPQHGLMFTATSIVEDLPQEQCLAAAEALTLAGYSDWNLPTIDELSLLIDRTRYEPAIDTDYFPDILNDWYKSRTEAAWPPEYVWNVLFSDGSIGLASSDGLGFALACRRTSQ